MKSITIHLSPEEAHNSMVLIDLALKHPEGGIKVLKAANAIVDKINAAVVASKENIPCGPPDAPA